VSEALEHSTCSTSQRLDRTPDAEAPELTHRPVYPLITLLDFISSHHSL
jgi:hypothetical protein